MTETKFEPDSQKIYRVFSKEWSDDRQAEVLRETVGYVHIYDDGSILIRSDRKKPDVYMRSYVKLVEFVAHENDKNGGR